MSKNLELDERIINILNVVGKNVGKDSLRVLAAGYERRPCGAFGLPSLDVMLNGGIPHGTLVEMWGGEGAGKTTLALSLLGNQIKNKHIVGIIDAEHKLDPILARNLGVDLSLFPFSQPKSAEEAFDIIYYMSSAMQSGDTILVDSAAALVPEAMLEADMDQKFFGGNSIVVSQGLKKILHIVSEKGVIVIFINQIREKIGLMFGNPEITPCGRSLKFHANARIEVRRGQILKNGDNVIGQEVKVKTIKTSHCAPLQEVTLDLHFGKGFNKVKSLLDVAVQQGIIQQGGAWYTYGENKFQGMDKLVEFVNANGYDEILAKVKI